MMEKGKIDTIEVCGGIVVLVILLLWMFGVPYLLIQDNDKIRKEAVERGYAIWKVDKATGKTTWQWKDEK